MKKQWRSIAKRLLQAVVDVARWCGWDLAGRLTSTHRLAETVPGVRYQPMLAAELVTVQEPAYQAPHRPAGRYLEGIARWGLDYYSHEAGLLELPGGRFEIPQCAVIVAGRIVEESYIFCEFPLPWTVHRYLRLSRAGARELEPGTFLPMLGYKNYYHWMVDILPRLQLIQSTPWQDRPVYVHQDLPSFAKQSLQRLSFDFRFLPRGYYCSDRVCIPTRLSQNEFPSPAAIRWLRMSFLGSDPVRSGRLRRLFISREDAPSRRLPQEQELFEMLQPLGFECITPGRMSLAEQIQLFGSAEVVAGPHGAGFTNILWMPRGGALVEATSDAHVGHSFWRMCNQLQHRYGFLEASTSGGTQRLDLAAYVGLVRRAVDDVDSSIHN